MKKSALIILDGWGIGENNPIINAIYAAETPFMDEVLATFPNASLKTFGENVGLPDGQMGNSEVGHLNIGAGRTVYQMLALINKSMKEKELLKNPVFLDLISNAKKGNKKIHLLGLVSDGGVHSHINHLIELTQLLNSNDCKNLFIHAFTDGRDTDPKSGINFIQELQIGLKNTNAKIATVIGRYYAMDRDKRWERVKLAYDLLVHAKGEKVQEKDLISSLETSYQEGITDEFIKPISIRNKEGNPISIIEEDDIVIFFNFRTDRGRQLTQALSQLDFPDFNMQKLKLDYYTFTSYDKSYNDVNIFYNEQNLSNTIGEVISAHNLTQLRVAETEKYPHVSFFFNGGRELPFPGEERLMIPSAKVATYDLQPQMSAKEITSKTIDLVQTSNPDFIALNYANPDMVGHTGVFSAVKQAIETVDICLSQLIPFLKLKGYEIIIIADHGNADFMVNPDGTPNTAHTTNLVPIILISADKTKRINNGKLADVAPTLLNLMGITPPIEMDGNNLVN